MNLLFQFFGGGRRLAEMTAVAKRIAGGHLHERFLSGRRDDLGELAKTMNDIVTQLDTSVVEGGRQRARLESMLKGLASGVVAVDHQDRVQFVNPTFEQWCGKREEEILNRSLLEALRHHELAQVLSAAREQGAEQHREIILLGTVERSVEVQAAPLKFEGGLAGAVAVLYDVTELRRLERIRQDFVANVSHELRTPLTAIRGAVETLQDGASKNPKSRESFLAVVLEHTKRLERLVEDLLDLSAVERQATSLRLEPVALKPLCNHVFALHRPSADRQAIKLENRLEESLPLVLADPFRLEQIVSNLVENAVKFNVPKGRVWLEAVLDTPKAGHAEGGRVTFSVHDTGTGIPAKDLPRIFERFYRVDKARSRQVGGTGLGLSLVKHLVEAQGGEVSIESEEEKGTVVRVMLPEAPNIKN